MENTEVNIRMNQNRTSFACQTENEVKLFDIEPFRVLKRITFSEDYKLFGMYNRRDILYTNTDQPGKLKLFDMEHEEVSATYLYEGTLTAVCMNDEKIVISSLNKLFILTFPKGEHLKTIDIPENPKGLLEITQSLECEKELVIYPGKAVGSLKLLDIKNIKEDQHEISTTLSCHKTELSCIVLNLDGTKAATAAVDDNIIRVWDTVAKTILLEFASDIGAPICSLAFNKRSCFLSCTTEKGTGFIFSVDRMVPNDSGLMMSVMHWLGYGYPPFAEFKLEKECKSICIFGIPNTLLVVGLDQTINKFGFPIYIDPQGDKNSLYVDRRELSNPAENLRWGKY